LMEDDFDFEAALEAKGLNNEDLGVREAPQGTPSEEVAEDESSVISRDERGRFTAAGSQETEEQTEAEKLLAGKYKTVEDLERAYQEASSKLGQQGSELGELRKLIEERLPAEDETEFEQPTYDPSYASSIQNLVESGRFQEAAVYAAQSGNQPLYEAALDAWYDEQPRAAAAFERHLELQAMEARFQQQRQPEIQARVQQEANTAWSNVSRKFTDLPQLADKVLEAGKHYPDVLRVLQTDSSIEGKERALEALYKIAKADSLDTLGAAAKEAEQVASDEARREKADSVVASASNAKREAPTTKVDAFKQAIMDADEISTYSGRTFKQD